MNIELIKPNPGCKERVLAFKKEFIDHNEELRGTAFLETTEEFDEWLDVLKKNFDEETVLPGYVPASTYMVLTDEREIVGMVGVRHKLDDTLEKFSGNISYSIARKFRNQGFATQILKKALGICEIYGMEDVLVTCDKENLAGIRTIEKNGGKFENSVDRGDKIINRYLIDIRMY